MKEVTKATVEARIRATGNGYAFFVPKALLDCNVLEGGKFYKVEIKEVVPENQAVKAEKVLNKESVSAVEAQGSIPSYPTGIVLGCSSDIDVGSPVIWNRSPDWGAEWLLKHYDQIT